mmetsp:Transcript_10897/g.20374  ORF Transcript_10897/g.20374 Transcript_10897/m.20374 type:complete len:193 (-) Transcript_10897:211-789(-)|eukprot:CAMPEP_0176484124 /NCGR_PEP_ID=MMETSP0200_2-20121128/4286_1 /TAXON_ID=947934 /ORGANISM="Chaetoceros sp., Strain GSL56" /LENGTH=192 /DNA_ID=CAMNT_0017880575 /DNA_START=132 /DNA_END=710 /DNA_ORIENTATION=+
MRILQSCVTPFIFIAFSLCHRLATANDDEHREFWDACAHGDLEIVSKYIRQDPELAKKSTSDGESCLHLTAISNSVDIAKLMIEHGTNVNLRVTHPLGLRMTPLAWHTHAGNVSIVKLLLQNGAEVNADFDAQHDPNEKVTAMDVARSLIRKNGNHKSSSSSTDDETFLALKQFGGLSYAEILAQDGENIEL